MLGIKYTREKSYMCARGSKAMKLVLYFCDIRILFTLTGN